MIIVKKGLGCGDEPLISGSIGTDSNRKIAISVDDILGAFYNGANKDQILSKYCISEEDFRDAVSFAQYAVSKFNNVTGLRFTEEKGCILIKYKYTLFDNERPWLAVYGERASVYEVNAIDMIAKKLYRCKTECIKFNLSDGFHEGDYLAAEDIPKIKDDRNMYIIKPLEKDESSYIYEIKDGYGKDSFGNEIPGLYTIRKIGIITEFMKTKEL